MMAKTEAEYQHVLNFLFGQWIYHNLASQVLAVLINLQLVCWTMGKVNNRSLLEGFPIIDHNNHSLFVTSRHFDLRAQSQLAMGSRQSFFEELPLAVWFP